MWLSLLLPGLCNQLRKSSLTLCSQGRLLGGGSAKSVLKGLAGISQEEAEDTTGRIKCRNKTRCICLGH